MSNQVHSIQSCNFINCGELFFQAQTIPAVAPWTRVITSESTINLPIVTLDARLCSTGEFCLDLDNRTEEYPNSDEYGEYPAIAVREPPPTHRTWALPVLNLDNAIDKALVLNGKRHDRATGNCQQQSIMLETGSNT